MRSQKSFILFMVVLGSSLMAQWPTSPDSPIDIGSDGGVFKAISDNHGGVYIVRGAISNIYCSRIDSSGNTPWIPQVLDYDGDEIWFSGIATSSDDGLFVSYHDYDFDGPGGPAYVDIKVQKLDRFGNKMWGTGVTISPPNSSGDSGEGELLQSKIIGATDGGAYIIWGDLRDGGWLTNLFIQRLSGDGEPLWNRDGVRVADGLDGIKYLFVDEDNSVTIVYVITDLSWNRTHYVQTYSDSGLAQLEESGFELPTRSGTYYSLDSLGNLFYRYGVDHIVRVNIPQLPNLDWFDVLIESPGETYVRGMCPDDSGGVFFTIYDDPGRSFYQRLNIDGNLMFGDSGIAGPPSGYWERTTLTKSGEGFILILSGDQQVAYKINPIGSHDWANVTIYSGSAEYHPWPTAISDGIGGAIYLFENNYHTYANKVSAEGVLGGTSPIVSEAELPRRLFVSAYPNPFNPSTTIEYEIPEYSEVSLIIYDIAGRETQIIVSDSQSAGRHTINWDGTNLVDQQVTAGMYFARLQAGQHSSVAKMVYLR